MSPLCHVYQWRTVQHILYECGKVVDLRTAILGWLLEYSIEWIDQHLTVKLSSSVQIFGTFAHDIGGRLEEFDVWIEDQVQDAKGKLHSADNSDNSDG
ncbi:hypothetical protein PR048_010354 [Dryococelus australis]|uniref:MHC class I antigen n=1 Tax=Dryococelus australis TaxID=614101 RepID=A0ABQ9I3M4_9NEOP|nr:hypothetical protein PR048_010354 [Dryococelus australis]